MARRKSRIQIQAEAGNPVVAVAQKTVRPTWRSDIGRWVSAHKQDIFLTAGFLSTLVMGYLMFKKGLDKMKAEYIEVNRPMIHDITEATGALNKQVTILADETMGVLRKQSDQIGEIEMLKLRHSAIEKTMGDVLKDPRFHEWLAKTHGITDVKPAK